MNNSGLPKFFHYDLYKQEFIVCGITYTLALMIIIITKKSDFLSQVKFSQNKIGLILLSVVLIYSAFHFFLSVKSNLMVGHTMHFDKRLALITLCYLLIGFGEEIIYRGMLCTTFLKCFNNRVVAIILSSFIFAGLHLKNIIGKSIDYYFINTFVLTLCGIVFAVIYLNTNIWVAIFYHALYDIMINLDTVLFHFSSAKSNLPLYSEKLLLNVLWMVIPIVFLVVDASIHRKSFDKNIVMDCVEK